MDHSRLIILPVGILEQADFAHTTLTLGEADTVVLVSDGVTQGNSEWLGELLAQAEYDSAQALAKSIAETAHANFGGVHEDDISVAVLQVLPAQKAENS